jgi:hypothetical protein
MVYAQNFARIPNAITPNATIAGNIEIFENIWKPSQETINSLEAVCADPESGINWTRATTIGEGVDQQRRTNWDLGINYYLNTTRHPLMVNLHNNINDMLVDAATGYCHRHNIIENFWQEGYNMLKYTAGQQYTIHYDGATYQGRHISCVLYLNDDYEGGELEFPAFKIKIKPQTGMLILFPSNFAYRHIAHPITKGTKYAMSTWLHDRPII